MILKSCPQCKKEKPEFEFSCNRNKPDGLCYWCKECQKQYNREHYSKQHNRDLKLEYLYGLRLGEFEMISKSQDDKCLICKQIKTLVPDHDHKTGKFRALLCHKCNLCVGLHENYPVEEYLNKPEWKFLLVWLSSRNHRDSKLRYDHNICLNDWEMMFEVQNKVCGICGKASKRNLAVDHDWNTLRIRGLLCCNCNHILGRDDNHNILGYIHHFSNNQT